MRRSITNTTRRGAMPGCAAMAYTAVSSTAVLPDPVGRSITLGQLPWSSTCMVSLLLPRERIVAVNVAEERSEIPGLQLSSIGRPFVCFGLGVRANHPGRPLRTFLRKTRNRTHQTQTEKSSGAKHERPHDRALERHRGVDQLSTHQLAISSGLVERWVTRGRTCTNEKWAQRNLHCRRQRQSYVVDRPSATADSASAHALARAAALPPLRRPGCRGSATGVAEAQRRQALLHTPGRRETRVAGPRCRRRWTIPPAPNVSRKAGCPAAALSQVPMARYKARRAASLTECGTEIAIPKSRPSACSNPTYGRGRNATCGAAVGLPSARWPLISSGIGSAA